VRTKLTRLFYDPELRQARSAATRIVTDWMPTARVVWRPSLRARGSRRFVFAVFYVEPEHATRPRPYKLVAVALDSNIAEIIDPPRTSPYWIRNYR
jgi:hypothetical protein